MTDLNELTLSETRDGLTARKFSSVELTKAHLVAMEKARALNAYVAETADKALAMAGCQSRDCGAGCSLAASASAPGLRPLA